MKEEGNKRIKGYLFIILSVMILVLSAGTKGLAEEEALKIGLDQYAAQNGKLTVYINHNKGYSFQPVIEESTILIGKQKLNIEEIKTFQESQQPVSYLYLVDVSGSMDKERVGQAVDMLKQAIENKGDEDNFCIVTMGNNLTSSGFTTDKEKLISFADMIELTKEDTNLYHSIKEELNVLKTDQLVHDKRCLIIFSDGADDQEVGITREEAENVVKESHIPVFTIAMLKNSPKEKDVESAKILGSFARYSAGGAYYAPVLDEYDYSEVYTKMQDVIMSSLVVTADLTDVIAGDETIYIEAELSNQTSHAEDGMTVPSGEVLQAIKEAKENSTSVNVTVVKEAQEGVEAAEDPVEPPAEEKTELKLGVIIIAVLGLLCVVILIVIICMRRKDSGNEDTDINEDMEVRKDGFSDKIIDSERKDISDPDSSKAPSKLKVNLVKIGPGEEETYTMSLKKEIQIGRKKGCQLCLESDTALSGIHCTIFYKEGNVYVRDEESTNGTYVNGVPIVGQFKLEKADIILIGSYEYRISWE